MNRVIQHLHKGVLLYDSESLTDGQLLEAFVSSRDEAAFKALVRRHGRLVLGVCRRILGNAHDAEDAFQATFLVLVCKASSLRSRELLANWLYGVAYRTALKARAKSVRRRTVERKMRGMLKPEAAPEDVWQELLPVLDQELSNLPDKYRIPVILCDLEGRGRKEAARLLGVPEGTLSSRLATARKRLAHRLASHNIALSSGMLAALLTTNAVSACVPPPLLAATMNAAMLFAAGNAAAVSVTVVALTGGVLKTMLIAKLKMVTAVVLGVAALGLGTGRVFYQARAGAADSAAVERQQRTDPVRVSRLKRQEEQEPIVGKGRKQADNSSDRERALREELEKARREVASLRAELQKQRRTAAVERRRAKVAPIRGKAQASKGDQKLAAKNVLDRLKEQEARVRKNYEQSRQALLNQLKSLDVKQQNELDDIKKKRDTLLRQPHTPQPPLQTAKAPAASDKLDRVLQKLEQFEKRLKRLERGNSK